MTNIIFCLPSCLPQVKTENDVFLQNQGALSLSLCFWGRLLSTGKAVIGCSCYMKVLCLRNRKMKIFQ